MSCQGRRPASRTERFVRAGKLAIGCLLAQLMVLSFTRAYAAEAEWIWSEQHKQAEVPAARRVLFPQDVPLKAPEQGQIALNADDATNSTSTAGASRAARWASDCRNSKSRGSSFAAPTSSRLKVSNKAGKTAALAARVSVKERNGEWESYSSTPVGSRRCVRCRSGTPPSTTTKPGPSRNRSAKLARPRRGIDARRPNRRRPSVPRNEWSPAMLRLRKRRRPRRRSRCG